MISYNKNKLIFMLALFSTFMSKLLAENTTACHAQLTSTTTLRPVQGNQFTFANYVKISPNGKCVAVTRTPDGPITDPGSIALYAYESKCCKIIATEPTQTLLAPGIRVIEFSPSGNILVAADQSRTIYVYKVNKCGCTVNPTPQQTFVFPQDVNPADIVFSPDGRFMAVALLVTQQIALYGVNKKGCVTKEPLDIYQLQGSSNDPFSLAYSTKGNCLVAVLPSSNSLSLFKVDTCTGTLGKSPQIISGQGLSDPLFANFSPRNNCLAVTNGGSNSVSLFSFDSSTCTLTPFGNPIPVEVPGVLGITYSADGNCLLVASFGEINGAITIFQVDRCSCKLNPHVQSLPVNGQPLLFSLRKRCFVVSNFVTDEISAILSYKLSSCS